MLLACASKRVHNAPCHVHLTPSTKVLDEVRVADDGFDGDVICHCTAVLWQRIKGERRWVLGAFFFPLNSEVHTNGNVLAGLPPLCIDRGCGDVVHAVSLEGEVEQRPFFGQPFDRFTAVGDVQDVRHGRGGSGEIEGDRCPGVFHEHTVLVGLDDHHLGFAGRHLKHQWLIRHAPGE